MIDAPAVVAVGQTGAWVGPVVVGILAGALDYSAFGAHAWRDRIAVAGYYACTVSMAALLGWTDWIRASVGTDYNWRMAGAVVSLVTHGALLLGMFGSLLGPTRAIGKVLATKIKFNSAESKAARINQTLLNLTVAAGLSSPLSGSGGWGSFVDTIATATTGLWGALVGVVFHWLGG